jgi:hypothetical protein
LNEVFTKKRGLDGFYDKFSYGFQRSAVRFQLRQSQSCITDGLAFVEGMIGVAIVYFYHSRS